MENSDAISSFIEEKISEHIAVIRTEIQEVADTLNSNMDLKFIEFQNSILQLLNNKLSSNPTNIINNNSDSISGTDTKRILKEFPIHEDLPRDDDDDLYSTNNTRRSNNNITTNRNSNSRSNSSRGKSLLAAKYNNKNDFNVATDTIYYDHVKEYTKALKDLTVPSVLSFLQDAHKFELQHKREIRNIGKQQNISDSLRTIIMSRLFNSPGGLNITLPDNTNFHMNTSKFDGMSLVELTCVLESCFPSANANDFLSFIEQGIDSFKVDLSRTFPSLNNWEEYLLPPLIEYLDKFHELYLFLFPRWTGSDKDRPKIEPPKNIQHANKPNLLFLFLNGFPYEFLFNLYNNYLKSTNWNTSPEIEANDMTKFIIAIKDHIKIYNKLCMESKIFNRLFSGETVKSLKTQIIKTYQKNSLSSNRINKFSNNTSTDKSNKRLATIEYSDSNSNLFYGANPEDVPHILNQSDLSQYSKDSEDEDNMQRDQFDFPGKKSFIHDQQQLLLTNEDSSSNSDIKDSNLNAFNHSSSNEVDEVCYKAAFSPTGKCGNDNCSRLHKGPLFDQFIRNTHKNLTSHMQKLNLKDSNHNSSNTNKSSSLVHSNKTSNVSYNNDPHYKSILKKQVASINNVSVENEHMNAYKKMMVKSFLGSLNLSLSNLRDEIIAKLILTFSILCDNKVAATIKLLVDTGNFAHPIIYYDAIRHMNAADLQINYVNNRLLLPNGIWMTAEKEVVLTISIQFKGQTYSGEMNFVLIENVDSRNSPFNAIIGLFPLIFNPRSQFLPFAKAVFQDLTDFIGSRSALNAIPYFEIDPNTDTLLTHSTAISPYSMLGSILSITDLPVTIPTSNSSDDDDDFDFLTEFTAALEIPVPISNHDNPSFFPTLEGGMCSAVCEMFMSPQSECTNWFILSNNIPENLVFSSDEDIPPDKDIFNIRNN